MESLFYGIAIVFVFILTAIFALIERLLRTPAAKSGGIVVGADELQDSIHSKYKSLVPRGRVSFEDFCFPKKYRIQPQQIFCGDFMDPLGGRKSLLVYHKIGAGKSCVAIQITRRWLGQTRPLVIMPASLVGGFRAELRTKCAANLFIDRAKREILAKSPAGSAEYRSVIEESNRMIDDSYNIMSFNRFLTHGSAVDSQIIVIDEVQNINNAKGKIYQALLKWLERHPAAVVVAMSGTPIFDSARELITLAKILRIDTAEVEEDSALFTPAWITRAYAGHVSYFGGAPSYTFPAVTVKVVQCVMSKFQAKWYKSEVEAEESKRSGQLTFHRINNDFYIKSRQRSNIVYPSGLVGTVGYSHLAGQLANDKKMAKYSAKYYKLIRSLRKGALSFVYSSFAGWAGIKIIAKILDEHGYSNYSNAGPGPRRYALWTGAETIRQKDEIRAAFNNPANDDASQIQIIIGSPSIKEGVSLMRVRQVHVIEAYWNHSRLEQIYGRAVRYCSHKTLPAADRDVVIKIYAAVTRVVRARERDLAPAQSVDLYMLRMADKKSEENGKFTNALIKTAVDKKLWKKK